MQKQSARNKCKNKLFKILHSVKTTAYDQNIVPLINYDQNNNK